MNKTRFGFFFILLVLLASQMVVQTEGRHCESKSHRFKGMCLSDHNCASVCHVEGFPGGFSQEVPEEDFKSLLEYWRDEKTQEVSHQNAQNIAQLKFRHRTGNKSFAVIRENMR
ncbi:hypothetical protein P8452_28383 [Trifolium repens]|nr:hypothetical protein P8452_28383 [Trifolium repens]